MKKMNPRLAQFINRSLNNEMLLIYLIKFVFILIIYVYDNH